MAALDVAVRHSQIPLKGTSCAPAAPLTVVSDSVFPFFPFLFLLFYFFFFFVFPPRGPRNINGEEETVL